MKQQLLALWYRLRPARPVRDVRSEAALALVETGQVVVHPHLTGVNAVEFALRAPGESSAVRGMPESLLSPCARELERGWAALDEPDEFGISVVVLTDLGAQWLCHYRGNHGTYDLRQVPQALANIEWARAAFRIDCEDRGVDHGHVA